MNTLDLTKLCGPAHNRPIMGRSKVLATAVVMLGSGAAGGCVQVTAPDTPIVIELNINIRQEVIYRLAADAGNTIEENSDIF